MKKILFSLIGILTSVTTLADVGEYEQTVENNILKYQYDTETGYATLIDGKNITATKVDFILSSFNVEGIGTYTVTSIGAEAFTTKDGNKYIGNTSLEYVVIPEGVTAIEANAFNNCSNIKFLELPKTINSIATNAFSGCTRLAYVCCNGRDANISIPASLPTNDLMTLFVPNDCAKNAENCYLYPDYQWTNKFKDRIYEGHMEKYYSETENMTYVCAEGNGKQAILIEGKRGSDIVIKSKLDGKYDVVGIGNSAFYGFSEIYTLKIGDGVTTISNGAFQRCSNLRKLELPSTLNTIGSNAFADCNNLRHVWCKVEDATKLDATRFPNRGMMTLYVPNDNYNITQWNTQFGSRIYKGEMKSKTIDGLEYVYCPEANVATLYNGNNADYIDIPATIENSIPVTGIDRGAFYGFSNIKKVKIPNYVTAIGSYAFNGCNNLTIVDCKIDVPFAIEDNVFNTKAKATLFVPTGRKSDYNNTTGWKFMDIEDCESMTEFSEGGMNYVGWTKNSQNYAKLIKGVSSITNIGTPTTNGYSVIAIGESAFSGISSLETLSIAEGIQRIEANAFKNCRDLGATSLSLPSTLTEIGTSAFQGCTGLKIVTLPTNISAIGDKAFKDCTNLVEVVCNMSNPVEITSTTFTDDGLILYKPSSWIGQQYKEKGWNFSHDFTGNKYSVTKSDLTYVCGASDPSERKEMILLTNNLTSESDVTVTIPITVPETDKKVIAIAKNAFLRNTKLKDVNILEGIKNIGSYAFRGCSKLTTITLPSSLTDINDYAFDQCTNITKITSKIEGSKLFILQEHVFPTIVPTIYIPGGSATAYKTKEGWKRFENSYRVGEATHNVNPDGISYMFYDCYSEEEVKTATLTKVQWAEGITSITVPSTITVTKNGVETVYNVTAVAESIFDGTDENKAKYSSLVIEEGIKTIGSNAFKNWRGLTSITLPKSLTTIGQSAFQGNNNANFITINIPENVETIGSYAFQGCSNLKTVTLPEKLNSIDEYAFANLSSLEKLVIPNNVDVIGAYAFSGCTKLRIVLPNKLKTIGDFAFEYNKATEKLEIPEGVETIGIYAFKECTSMKEVVLPSSLKKIDYFAFNNCTNLTTIISKIKKDDIFDINVDVFPESVRNSATLFVPIDEVNENEGENVDSKTKAKYKEKDGWKEFVFIEVGEKILYTDEKTTLVYECLTGLLKATLIGIQNVDKDDILINNTFTITKGEETKTYKVIEIGESAFSVDKNPNTKNIRTITIADGITKIGANAFKGCSSLTTISFPKELATIGANAFNGCTSLVDIIINLPSSLETIDVSAFQGCNSLPKIKLPSSLKTIGKSAFKSCTSLQKLWLPASLTSIGDEAFSGCGLTNVNIEHENPLTLSENVFSIISGNTATLFVPKGKKISYNTVGWDKFSNVVEGELVEAYTDDAKKMTFSCYTTTDAENKTVNAAIVTKSNTGSSAVKIDEIYNAAVNGSEETIPYQVVAIGKYAFNNCTNIKSLELPQSLRSIGSSAFGGCSAIREIVSDVDKVNLFKIDDDVFHADVKTQATLYVPLKSKSKYEETADWSSFDHNHIVNGKWKKTIDEDNYHLKYRYHTGDKIATVIEIVFPESETELVIPSTFTVGEGENAIVYNIDSIAPSSFSNKDKVKKLTINDAVEGKNGIKTIAENAFKGCTNLATIYLPSSLGEIGENAFNGCSNIANLNIQRATSFDINANVFSISEGNKATLFVHKGTADSYNKDGWNKFSNVVEGEFVGTYVGSIDKEKDLSFSYYTTTDNENKPVNAAILTKSETNKQALQIPSTIKIEDTDYIIKTIGSYSFSTSRSLTNLAIPVGIEKIGKYAFNTCTGLKSIELPSSLTSIGSSAFGGCSAIREIVSDIDKDHLFKIDDDVFHADAKSQAKLYVPIGSKVTYEGKEYWSSFVHDNIVNGKWMKTTTEDDYHLKYRYHTGNKIATVIEIVFPEDKTELVIPSTFTISEGEYAGTYNIDSIAPSSFSNKDKVKKLTINGAAEGLAGIKTIGANSFNGCTNLVELRLPKGITKICSNAFQGCTNLQKVWLPASLTSIGSKAFNGCGNLTRLCIETIPNMENTDAFSTYNKTLLFVPTGTLSSLGEGWRDFSRKYEGYYENESPDGVDRAYIYLKQTGDKHTAILTKSKTSDLIKSPVVFENNSYDITIIGENAFNEVDLSGLNSLTDGIVVIEKNAFRSCKFTELSMPQTLKKIDDGAFSGNDKLTSLTLNDNLESIGDDAFKGCSSLKNILLPSSLTKIGTTAFDGCSNLTEVVSKITDENVIKGNTSSMPYAMLYVPEGTKKYYDGNWTCMRILEGDRKYESKGVLGYAYSTGDKKAILIEANTKETDVEITIPGTLTIGEGESAITCDVVAIDKAVFKNNTTIKKVTIEDKVEIIGASAFQGCSNLKMIELPASLQTIGENAFDGCTGLTEVVCKSDNNKFVTENALSLPNATLYVHEGTSSWYEGKWTYAHIYEGERLTEVKEGLEYAYAKGSNAATLISATDSGVDKDGTVTIPSSISIGEPAVDYKVIDIANNVFKDNIAIKTVEIGKNIQSIGANVFAGCSNLKEVVSKIEDPTIIAKINFSASDAILYVPKADLVDIYKQSWTFANYYVGNRLTTEIDGMSYVCATGDKKAMLVSGITEKLGENITIPGSIVPEGETEKYTVTGIAEKAFSGNVNIVSVNIDEGVKTIGTNAFQGCSKLNKVWLPSTLESIAEKAFDKCNNIVYICTKSKTPLVSPNINNNVFSTYKATIYVPDGAFDSYGKSDVWKTFPIIREGYFKGVKTEGGLTFDCIIKGQGESAKNVAILTKSETTDKEVEILSSVKLDGDDATSYTVTTISKEAFSGNNSKNLEKIIFPATLNSIEDEAFKQCTKLSVITSKIAKDNLLGFNKNVFPESIYTTAVVYIPNDEATEAKYKETEGWKEFKNWAKGEKKTVTLGCYNYDYLIGVGTATLTATTTEEETVTIAETIAVDGKTYTVTAIGESAFNKNPNRGKMTQLRISENIVTIGANAFQSCSNLKKVWLPSTLTNIGAKAFDGCNNITHVSTKVKDPALISENVFPTSATLFVPDGTKANYSTAKFSYVAEGELKDELVDNGFTYDCLTNSKVILKKYTGTSNDVVIPSSVALGSAQYTVAVIAKPAFASKTSITSLVIPAGVEEIDAETFSACNSLLWIESNIVNPIKISNVFANNTATLFIPSNSKVENYKASGWNFRNIYRGDKDKTTVDGSTYYYTTEDKKAILIQAASAKDLTIKGTVTINNGKYTVTAIAESVFKGKTNMVTLKIEDGFENIGANAFFGCSSLKKVEFPATLSWIGNNAFYGCGSLQNITCEGKSPSELGDKVFNSSDIKVNVPNDAVEAYKNSLYWGMFGDNILGISTSLTDDASGDYIITTPTGGDETPTVKLWNGMDASGDYVIPETVTIDGLYYRVSAIDEGACENNINMTSVTIPSTISSIGESAFAGCYNLKSITVYNETPIDLPMSAATRGALTRSGSCSVFEGVNKNTCILYVPSGSVDAYKAKPGWSEFKNILAIGTTAINGVVISDDGKPFDIYNMQGRKVKDNVTSFDGLPSGIYIVNGKKVMVK